MDSNIFLLLVFFLVGCSQEQKYSWKLKCAKELDTNEVYQVFKTDPGEFHKEDSVIFQKVLSIIETENEESAEFEFYFRQTSRKQKAIVIYGINNTTVIDAITCRLIEADFSKETKAIVFVFADASEESRFKNLPLGFRIDY